MVTGLLTAAAVLLTLLAEILHDTRLRRVGRLAFGPEEIPARWTRAVPLLRMLGAGLLTWGALTLLFDVAPKIHKVGAKVGAEPRHLILVLDVSPSMRLKDAGPSLKQSRTHRARDVLQSMFSRIATGRHKVSVIATYTNALPVVVDTTDAEVVHNVLSDLPMHFAFNAGKTRLFSGLREAARIAAHWKPGSATLVVISDGDTLPPKGMPEMPDSIHGALVIGVGDPATGTFINGRNSRQDVSALRQMAVRLGGTYHDGNKRQVASSVLADITDAAGESALLQFTKREYALLAIAVGALLLALIPLLLHAFGTRWRPGRPLPGAVPAERRVRKVS